MYFISEVESNSNLNKHIVDTMIDTTSEEKKRKIWLNNELDKKSKTLDTLIKKTDKIYEKHSALEVMDYIENCNLMKN